MGFNFGAFAGGLSDGLERGMKMGKSIRDLIRENEKEAMLKQAREEAGAAYDAQNAAAKGLPGATPATAATTAPVPEATPATPDTPDKVETHPVPDQPAPNAVALASPTASPDAASAASSAQSLAPSVATQTPAPVKPTPQEIEAAVKKPDAPANPDAPSAPVAATPDAPAAPAAPAVTPPVAAVAAPVATPQAVAAKGVPGAVPAAPAAPAKPDPQARADYIQREMGNRAADYFTSIGDIDTADKWRKHAETADGRATMRDWAKAYTAPDFDSMLDRFGKFYTDHVNDGVDYKSHEIVNRDGQQIGVITLRDKATGKEQKMELTQEKVMQLAEANNPAALFASEAKKQALVAASKVKLQEKAAEAKIKAVETVYKEGEATKRTQMTIDANAARDDRTGQRKLSEITLKSQLDEAKLGAKAKAEAQAKIDMLKESGRSEEEINGLMPAILGIGEHKRTTDPSERRALIMSDLTKNDPTFSRLSEADKNRKVDESMRVVYGDQGTTPGAKPTAAPPATPGAKPDAKAPAAPAPAAAPVMVRDKKTGQVGKLVDGKFVPVASPPAAPPATAPAPPAAVAFKPPAAAGLPPAPAPAAPAAKTSLEQVLGPEMAGTAASIRQAYGEVAQLQEQTRQAAASGDQAAVVAAANAQQVARTKLEALMKNMQPGLRNSVMAALSQ